MNDVTPRKLSAIQAISDAANYVLPGFMSLLRLSWKYFAAIVALAILAFGSIAFFVRNTNETAIYVTVGVAAFAAFLITNAYYIAIARSWLLGEEAPGIARVYFRFLGRVLLLSLIIIAACLVVFTPVFAIGVAVTALFSGSTPNVSAGVIVLAAIGLIVLLIFTILLLFYLMGRLCTWMIAAAVDSPQTLREGWNVTKGAGIRILGGLLGLTILFAIVDATIEAALSPLLGVTSDSFEKMPSGNVSLPALFTLVLAKAVVFFPQTAASMVYFASIFKQASSR